jgi:class 3 adenylate cyclase
MPESSAAEQRRLAAILVADVSGYSRLVHADEAATIARLGTLRREIDAVLAEHGGRVVSSAGDGFLAEFASALSASAAALEIQQRVAARQDGMPEAEQLRFRIGLNVGDVLEQADDLFGDAINVAARLQELAPPGGVCASRALRDSVRGRLPCSFERVGKRQVKNIARPVTVYRLLPARSRRAVGWIPAAIAATLLLVIAAALWATLPSMEEAAAPAAEPAVSQPAASAPASPPAAPAQKPPPPTRAESPVPSPRPGQSVEGTAGDSDRAAAGSAGER